MPDRFSEFLGDQRGTTPRPEDELAGAADAGRLTASDVRVRVMQTGKRDWCANLTHDKRELHLNLSGLHIRDAKSKRRQQLITDIGAYVLWVVLQDPDIHFEELDREALHACELFTRKSMDQRALDGDFEP